MMEQCSSLENSASDFLPQDEEKLYSMEETAELFV
jgi:hypothetical protein